MSTSTATDTVCRNCGASAPRVFHRADRVPVHSCLLLDSRAEARAFPRGDLRLALCETCGFVQNNAFDPTVHDYSPRYEETQSFSPRFNRFAGELADDYDRRYALAGKTVVEIGCGKGDFLVGLCERTGCTGIGIDPSYRPDRRNDAARASVTFHAEFYSEAHTELAADLVLCRHTLEHIRDTRSFVETVRRAVGDDRGTVVSFELPDTERILDDLAFEDVYYEHCSYFTGDSLRFVFESAGFEVLDLRKVFGDQYLIVDARAGEVEPRPVDGGAWRRRADAFERRLPAKLGEWRAFLASAHARGERIAIWGSGSKAVSFLSTLEFDEEIDAIVDVNPHRHGKFIPGTGHEILAPSALMRVRPAIVVAMNAIYLDEIGEDLRAMGLAPELRAV